MYTSGMRPRCTVAQAVLVTGLLALSSCGKSSPDPDPPPGGDPGTRITGRERLGWDQDLLSGTDISEYTFVVYIDGARTPLQTPACSPAQDPPTVFSCTAPLPAMPDGRHTLEIAAARRADGADVESVKSTTLVVTKSSSAATGSASTASPAAAGGGVSAGAFDIAMVAQGLNRPADLAVAADGRLFVAERGGRVRIVEGGALAAEPALELDDVEAAGGSGLTGIALHPAFARNRYVYLAYTARAGAEVVYRVARYREVGGRLAEAAVLIDDVPAGVPGGARVRFAAGAHLVVAFSDLPGPGTARDDAASWSGKLLRMTDDGATPEGMAGTPVHARGVGVAEGMVVDPLTGDVWLAERRPGGGTAIGRARRRSAVAAPPLAHFALAGEATPGGIALSPLSATGAGTTELIVAAGSAVSRLRVRTGRPPQVIDRVDVSQAPLSCLTVAPDRSVYFCTDPGDGDAGAAGAIGRITLAGR